MGVLGPGWRFSGTDIGKSRNKQPYRVPHGVCSRAGNTDRANSFLDGRSEIRRSRADSGRIYATTIFDRRALSAPRTLAGQGAYVHRSGLRRTYARSILIPARMNEKVQKILSQ